MGTSPFALSLSKGLDPLALSLSKGLDPLALSLSKGLVHHQGFDRLSPNGGWWGFDKLSPSGAWGFDRLSPSGGIHQLLFLTRRYHSHSSRTCFCV
jgi:hypothetical protein